MKIKNKFLTIILTATLVGCSTKNTTVYKNTDLTSKIFDTVYSYQEAPETSSSASNYEYSLELLTKYNNLYDIYNNYDGLNNLKTINDNAGIQPVKVDKAIIDMLKEAKHFYELSNGEFDITMGSLLKVWHKYREEGISLNEQGLKGNLPTDEELQEASKYKGWDKVIIDEENSTVYITDSNVSLDVGGIAKGYAAEQVAKALQEKGISGGFVNVGRNIRTTGDKIDGSDWRIGVADPSGISANGLVAIKHSGAFSIVTSGDYERYYVASDGNNYHHIIDPSTLYPASLYHSVTIVTPDSGAADCLSTTLFTLSIEEGQKVLDKYKEESGNYAYAIWVCDQDKTQNTSGKVVNNYFITYSADIEDYLVWYE